MSRPPEVRLSGADREWLTQEFRKRCPKPVERHGLYIMVFLAMIGSCSGDGAHIRIAAERESTGTNAVVNAEQEMK